MALVAEARNDFGKGASRQLRRAGRVPAVVYGKGSEAQHLSFDAHEVFLAVKGKKNPVLTIAVDGAEQTVQVKEIQRHPVRRTIDHIDLITVEA